MESLYKGKYIHKIAMVQCRVATFVLSDYSRYGSVSSMIDNLGWDMIEQHRHLHHLQMFHKINYSVVGIKFPPEVQPLSRHTRLPNPHPRGHLQRTVDSLKFSFYPWLFLSGITLTFGSIRQILIE